MFDLVKKSIQVWKQANKDEEKQTRIVRSRQELAFLPAAIEVMETPPPKAARYIAWSIIGFFCVALLWSFLGKMDVIAVAQGRIVPKGNIKVVQALETAKIKSILVVEGQRVKKGDKLIELDPTDPETDRLQVYSDLLASRLQIVRLKLTLEKLSSDFSEEELKNRILQGDEVIRAASAEDIELQEMILLKDLDTYYASTGKYSNSIQQKRSALKVAASELENTKRMRSLYQDQFELSKKLYAIGSISIKEWLESKEKLLESEGAVITSENRLQETSELILLSQQELEEFIGQFRSDRLKQLEEIRKNETNLKLALNKTTERERNRYLLASVDGIVHQLKLHTVGGVVAPADVLMNIIPQNSGLFVEAMLDNKDVGFVKIGDAVSIKIDSFSYTKYGYIHGKVEQIGADAIADEKKGFVYPVKVSLSATSILVKDTMVPVFSGMTVSADIKTGKRRVIDYFITNFLEYQDESFRER
jgi:hemolysin D